MVEEAEMQTDASGPQPVPKVKVTPQPSLPVLFCLSHVITTLQRLIMETQGTGPCLRNAHLTLKGHCLGVLNSCLVSLLLLFSLLLRTNLCCSARVEFKVGGDM